MVSEKTAISQRWEKDFQAVVKHTAGQYGTTMTQLTLEALEIMVELASSDSFRKLNEHERRKLVVRAAQKYIEENIPQEKFTEVQIEGIQEIGLIRDKVDFLLKNNPGKEFSTNDIAQILSIPQSTARTYVRDISENNTTHYHLVRGRPNKIFYRSD